MLRLKYHSRKKLNKHANSSDVGPSTPGKAHLPPSVTSYSESKATMAGPIPDANIKSNDVSLMDDFAEHEFRKRIDQNCAVLATATQAEDISQCLTVNEFEAGQAYSSVQDDESDQMHNNVMRMLTRGLEETVGMFLLNVSLPYLFGTI